MDECVTVTRVGTQVVVRLTGAIDDSRASRLAGALSEVDTLVLMNVVVDCSDADVISGAGIRFLLEAHQRWRLRLISAPPGLKQRLLAG